MYGQGPKGFSFIFLDLFDFLYLFADLARACLGFLERPSRSCEVVRVRIDRTIAHRAAPLDRETVPDLTWPWTLAVVCAALAGVFKKRKYTYEIELN